MKKEEKPTETTNTIPCASAGQEPASESPGDDGVFPLVDGTTWGEGDAYWSDGLLKKGDVVEAVRALGESMRDRPTPHVLDSQVRFIHFASQVNCDCDPQATSEEIDDVLDTWNQFSEFLKAKTAGRQGNN